jgi:hypothetical protein
MRAAFAAGFCASSAIAVGVAACGLPGANGASGTGGAAAASSSFSAGAGGDRASSSSAGGSGQGGAAGHGQGGSGGSAFVRPIEITATSAAAPSGYGVSVTFDHAGLVTAHKSTAGGDDVRVYRIVSGVAVELDRVLGPTSQWNTHATELWFSIPAPVPAASSDDHYALYYGELAPPPALANPLQVFPFFDDFESGDLSNWSSIQPGFGIVTDQHRSGSHALASGARVMMEVDLVAKGVAIADMSVDAFWRISQPTGGGYDIAQTVRASTTEVSDYETSYRSALGGFDIGEMRQDAYDQLTSSMGTVMADKWTLVTTQVVGTKFRMLVGGKQLQPTTGWLDVGGDYAMGSIGFRAFQVPPGKNFWLDDVRVRPLVDPEPTTHLGAETPAPFPP